MKYSYCYLETPQMTHYFDYIDSHVRYAELKAMGFKIDAHGNELRLSFDVNYLLKPISGIEKWYMNIIVYEKGLTVHECNRLGRHDQIQMGRFVHNEYALSKAFSVVMKTCISRQKDLIRRGNKYLVTPEERHEHRGKINGRKFGF